MLSIIVRTATGFVVLLVLTRILGKKQLSQITFFTYITGIVLGEIIGKVILDKEIPVTHGLAALVIWCGLVLFIEWICLKSGMLRVLLDGEPAVVIKKGMIIRESLKKHRLNLDDLSMQLRMNDVFSIMDVEYAILEPNGQLTVLKKGGMTLIPGEVICDGKIIEKNLKELGYTRERLYTDLKEQGIAGENQVLYAELQADGKLYIQKM